MAHYDLELDGDLPADLSVLLATWLDGSREWRTNIDEVPPEAITWSPYPDGPNIGGIILHMAAAAQFWVLQIAEGMDVDEAGTAWSYDCTMDQYAPHWPKPPQESFAWYLEILDTNRQRLFDQIKVHRDSMSVHERNQNTMTYRWIIARQIEHDSYHGGQIVMLNEMYKKLAYAAD